jgi:L-threonylcarbamoyladenylate synthase
MSTPRVQINLPAGVRPDDPAVARQRVRLELAFRALTLEVPRLEALEGAVDDLLIQEGARRLREGGLVAFPTETVYGLGADARRPAAIERLYRVKGRPGSHPVIVHTAGVEAARACASNFPAVAERLAARFWPGPLTLVVPKADWVSELLTGGQDTVGLRVPSHPLARRLLAAFGGPVAAPSANRFGQVSPTTAQHVLIDLGRDVDAILDGGPCEVGVESTIIDARTDDPVILRPGGVTREAVEDELKRPVGVQGGAATRVSGALPSHYAPRAKVEVVDPREVETRAAERRAQGLRVKVLTAGEVEAHDLYASLRRADEEGVDVVVAPRPGEEGLGWAVADRLKRAAGPRS